MGAKESRSAILSYDEAVKRVTVTELKRIQEAYKRACGLAGVMREFVFIKDILGSRVPIILAQKLFQVMSTSSRGMNFRDVLVTLVLLTRGKNEERMKLIFAVYCDTNGFVTSQSMSEMVSECEKTALPHEALSLFKTNDNITYERFTSWVREYPNITSITRWLVSESGVTVSLTEDKEMPNFYQTLAGVTHLEESDTTELEKRYWQLKSQSKTGRFDLSTFHSLVSPPLPQCIIQGLFNAFDENRDGHIDFKEISCGVSACCRGPNTERQKFCFKIFDKDQDGKLNHDELHHMVSSLLQVERSNLIVDTVASDNEKRINSIVENILKSRSTGEKDQPTQELTLEEYQIWSLNDPLPSSLLQVIVEVCHIILGLRPSSPTAEGSIIRGWLNRANRREYKSGETWFVISMKWWKHWKQYTDSEVLSPSDVHIDDNGTNFMKSSTNFRDTISSAYEATEDSIHFTQTTDRNIKLPGRVQRTTTNYVSNPRISPGPINNVDILVEETSKVGTLTDEGGRIKGNLVNGVDFEVLPEPVWRALQHWYGGSPSLPRIVPAPVEGEKPWLELYRVCVVVLRHQLPTSMQQLNQIAFPGTSVVAGMGNSTLGMVKQTLNFVGGSNTPKRHPTHRATFSKRHTVGQISTFLSTRLHIPLENIRLWRLIDENNANLLEDESVKLESLSVTSNPQILLEVRNVDMSWPEELSQIARNHKLKMKQGQVGSKQVSTIGGASGLSNLGNTCFMNSGVQCISNTQPLTKYFLENKHLFELNKTNPLGMKGHMAKRYSDLAQELWSGTNKTIAPLKLRWTISKYAPRFNGFSQHDSQELLAFLLDGLHEDLNRVQEKPYVELKDSDGRPDEEVAQEAWENHLARNQSIIVDLFHGQIRSRVRCLECDTVSVRFDPFTFLSLPLPMDNSMYLDITVVRLSGETPIRYGLRLNMDDTFLEIRRHLAKKCLLPIEAILLVEMFGATVKSFLSDNLKLRTSTLGNLFAFEIPPPRQAQFHTTTTNNDNTTTTIKNNNTAMNGSVKNFEKSSKLNGTSFSSLSSMGSTVHETSKRTVTNHAALKNRPPGDALDDKDLIEKEQKQILAENPDISSNGDFDDEFLSSKTTNEDKSQMSRLEQRVNGQGDNNEVPDAINYPGYVVAFHRKSIHLDVYFLSSQKHRPSLFGLPIVVPCSPGSPNKELYSWVWKLVARFVSPTPHNEAVANHAQDCDDSLHMRYPFELHCVDGTGLNCGNNCPWFKFCSGCVIPCNNEPWTQTSGYISIDWDATALHLRYQQSVEREFTDDISVEEGTRGQKQKIDLKQCLRAFTTEEDLGKDELYHCKKCKKPQLAKKKLDIWRLPPILIIHLKRFHYVNGRWIKSHKVVNFPQQHFDPSNYMTKRGGEEVNQNPTDNIAESSPKLTNGTDFTKSATSSFLHSDKQKKKAHISFAEDKQTNDPQPGGEPHKKGTNRGGPARKRQPSFKEETSPLYNLYAVSCHSGILGGGHYIAYAKNKTNQKWYCYNDSSCREIAADHMNVDTAYTLFYELEGLDYDDFMPSTDGKTPVNTDNIDEDYNSEIKRYCSIM